MPAAASGDLLSYGRARLQRLREATDARSLPALCAAWFALGFHRSRSPNTAELYRYACRTLAAELPRDPEVPELELWCEALLARGLSRSTVAGALASARACARRAGRALGDTTLADRLDACEGPRAVVRRVRPPPADLLARALVLLPDRADRLWCLVLGLLALRRGEALGLRWSDLDLASGLVTVSRQRGRAARKNREPVILRLPPLLSGELAWARAHPEAFRCRSGPRAKDAGGRVFPWGAPRILAILGRLRAALGADAGRYLPAGDAWHAFRRLAAQAIRDASGPGVAADLAAAATLGDSPGRARGYYRDGPAPAAPVPLVLSLAPWDAPGAGEGAFDPPLMVGGGNRSSIRVEQEFDSGEVRHEK